MNCSNFNACPTPEGHESHEGLECPVIPASPCVSCVSVLPVSPVSPVSNGQEPENELEALAVRCACTCAEDNVRKKRFALARGVRALEKHGGWPLTTSERLFVFTKWADASQAFLDPTEDHLAGFLAAIQKVRAPLGEGDTLNNAINNVSKLSFFQLPAIPDMQNPPESWRRLTALHCELSRVSPNKDKTYFLSSRDAARVSRGLSHQTAHNINLVLAELGVIKIVRIGDKRLGGKATEFRYLLPA